MEFDNAADRDTYVKTPAPSDLDAFEESVKEIRVVDFEDGVF